MQYDHDPRRAAMLRDLLMNYDTEYRPAENAPMPPPGVADDEEALRAFFERFEASPEAQEFIPEGNYAGAPGGRPDAAMVPEGPRDFEMQEYLMRQMPQADDAVQPVPGEPNRARALAQMLRR